MEVSKWLGYVQQTYGNYIQYVKQQAVDVLCTFPSFVLVVESMQFPGDPGPVNMLVFKGHFNSQGQKFAVKAILPSMFPASKPKVYIDQLLDP